ncbi:ThuA domain-containing protein [Zhongshania sp.]|uniref:ThuA domain-containing protein n=1 Tax=Zhongshania sp. TaxID=1971902 RepID=UPI003562AF87
MNKPKFSWKKILRIAAVILALIVILPVAFLFYDQPGLFTDGSLDEVAPEMPVSLPQPAILVFSKTNGFRHKEAIPAAQKLLRSFADTEGWGYFQTENGAVHNKEQLAKFDVVIWANASGEVLTKGQETSLRSYIENGGGFIGIHAAGDGFYKSWDWYNTTVIKAKWTGHTMSPHMQEGEIHTINTEHPVSAGLPKVWRHYEEFYAFEKSPRHNGSNVLVVVDEASYEPGKYTMPEEHSMVWAHNVKEGRVVYTAMGHSAESFETPEFKTLLKQAIKWVGEFQ